MINAGKLRILTVSVTNQAIFRDTENDPNFL